MRCDHHVHFADWLAHRDQLVTDLRVAVSGFRVPGQHLHDSQRLANAEIQSVVRRQAFQAVKQPRRA